jgi:hypothetical protein
LLSTTASCQNGIIAVKLYLNTFLLVGSIAGVIIHFVTRESMPWWPDTAVMGAMFGIMATLGTVQHHRTNRLVWNALKRVFRRS